MGVATIQERLSKFPSIVKTRRSEIAETKLKFEGKFISYEKYKFSKQIIDTRAKGVVFKCGRQTAKSMTLATVTLTSLVSSPYRKFLYVAPTTLQMSVFSNDKIEARIKESQDFKNLFIDKECTRNVKEKSFTNDSRIYFRAATQLESIRGLSVHVNLFDEIQDIPLDNLGIIRETMSGQEEVGNSWYAGTPKSIHNGIESMWQESSQIIPILKCPVGHHNVPSIEMIHDDALRCSKCKEKIDLTDSYLRRMGNVDAENAGFWIPQIALPIHVNNPQKWWELVRKKELLPRDQFLNEVMGLSAGEGIYLLQEKHLVAATKNPFEFPMWTSYQNQYAPGIPAGINELWAGVDWGHTARRSFTVIMIGGYDNITHKFTVVFAKKLLSSGALETINEISHWIRHFGVSHVIPDYGGGWGANEVLQTQVECPVIPCIYAGERIRWGYDKSGVKYQAARSRTLIDVFNQIRNGRVHFFQWSQFRDMAKMFLAEFQETSEDNRGNVYTKFDHADNQPDDALHAFNLLFGAWKQRYDPAGYRFPG